MCGLARVEFDAALMARGLPVIRYMREMWADDLMALEKMRQDDEATEKKL